MKFLIKQWLAARLFRNRRRHLPTPYKHFVIENAMRSAQTVIAFDDQGRGRGSFTLWVN